MTWRVNRLPGRDHIEWARREGYLFSYEEWGELLATLGAVPMFAWNIRDGYGLAVPVFRLLGNRIGYLGFPVAGELLDGIPQHELHELSVAVSKKSGTVMARAVRSISISMDKSVTSLLPEIRIENLQSWTPGNKKLRRDLSFARRKASPTAVCQDPVTAGACFELYRETLRRHGGKARYTKEYFVRLVALSERTDLVRVYTVSLGAGTLDGFAVMARNGRTAYYLHGAVSDAGRAAGASDLLLEQVALHAQTSGCDLLSLMASPWSQPGLVEFKKKWGNEQGIVVTHDFALGKRGRVLRTLARWAGRQDRRSASEWLDQQ